MNENNTGKFIAELRKEKNLLQKDLAKEIFVSEKTISKWETLRGIPEISNLHLLSEYFGVTINELIQGQRNTDKTIKNENVDRIVVRAMETVENRYISRLRLSIFLAIIGIIFVGLLIYFINSYNSIMVYRVRTSNENYRIQNSILIKSKVTNIFHIGSLEFNHLNINDNTKFFVTVFIDKDKKWAIFNGEFNRIQNFENSGYNEMIKDTIDNELAEKIGDKLYMQVDYIDENGLEISDTVELEVNLEFANDKLFYTKGDIVGNDKEDEELSEVKNILLNKGFEQGSDNVFTKNTKEKKGDRTISINVFSKSCHMQRVKDNKMYQYLTYNGHRGEYMVYDLKGRERIIEYKYVFSGSPNALECIFGKCDIDGTKRILFDLENECTQYFE